MKLEYYLRLRNVLVMFFIFAFPIILFGIFEPHKIFAVLSLILAIIVYTLFGIFKSKCTSEDN